MSGIFSSGVAPATNQQDYVQTKQLMRQRGRLGILMILLDAPSLQFGACFVTADVTEQQYRGTCEHVLGKNCSLLALLHL